MQWLPLLKHTAQTSPGTTRFFLSIHPLHLPYMIPCSYRASACKAVLPSCMAFYVISVRQTRDLPVVSLFPHPASFRFHLAMDTLAFGYILPTTGRIRDLHPLETCAAGRTLTKKREPKLSFSMNHILPSHPKYHQHHQIQRSDKQSLHKTDYYDLCAALQQRYAQKRCFSNLYEMQFLLL